MEGEDDLKLLRKFFGENVILYESYCGKNGVKEIINHPIIDDFRIIGIRDKDYLIDNIHNRILFYDFCCLEMMLISVDEVFKSIYHEFYYGNMNVRELKEKILNKLIILSHLRKENELNDYKILFKGLSLVNYSNDNSYLNYNKLADDLKERSSSCNICIKELIENMESEFTKPFTLTQLLDVTNGHDFITIFKNECNQNNRSGVKENKIASSMRTSYTGENFKCTNLYKNLYIYAEENSLDIFL